MAADAAPTAFVGAAAAVANPASPCESEATSSLAGNVLPERLGEDAVADIATAPERGGAGPSTGSSLRSRPRISMNVTPARDLVRDALVEAFPKNSDEMYQDQVHAASSCQLCKIFILFWSSRG